MLQILQAGLESGLQRLGYWTPAMQDTRSSRPTCKLNKTTKMNKAALQNRRKIRINKIKHNPNVYKCVLYWRLPNAKARPCPGTDRKMQAWQTLTESHRRKQTHRETERNKQATQSNSCAWVKPVLMQTIDSFSASWSWTYILGSCSEIQADSSIIKIHKRS